LRAGAVLAILAAGGVLAGLARAAGGWRDPLAAGCLLSTLLVLAGYGALTFTLHRSDRAFFAAFAGGMLGRLAVLGLAAWRVHAAGRWPVAPFALGAAAGLIIVTFVELIFLQAQNRWTSSTRSNTTSSTTSTSA
jgi:hypothetical protein